MELKHLSARSTSCWCLPIQLIASTGTSCPKCSPFLAHLHPSAFCPCDLPEFNSTSRSRCEHVTYSGAIRFKFSSFAGTSSKKLFSFPSEWIWEPISCWRPPGRSLPGVKLRQRRVELSNGKRSRAGSFNKPLDQGEFRKSNTFSCSRPMSQYCFLNLFFLEIGCIFLARLEGVLIHKSFHIIALGIAQNDVCKALSTDLGTQHVLKKWDWSPKMWKGKSFILTGIEPWKWMRMCKLAQTPWVWSWKYSCLSLLYNTVVIYPPRDINETRWHSRITKGSLSSRLFIPHVWVSHRKHVIAIQLSLFLASPLYVRTTYSLRYIWTYF